MLGEMVCMKLKLSVVLYEINQCSDFFVEKLSIIVEMSLQKDFLKFDEF